MLIFMFYVLCVFVVIAGSVDKIVEDANKQAGKYLLGWSVCYHTQNKYFKGQKM